MSCSRHSSATLLGPRQLAETTSCFCCAVNFPYLRFSLKVVPRLQSGNDESLLE